MKLAVCPFWVAVRLMVLGSLRSSCSTVPVLLVSEERMMPGAL